MVVQSHSRWIDGEGPDNDVVLSCRVRMARNLAGFPFTGRASEAQRQDILALARQSLLADDISPGMMWVDLVKATPLDRRLLFERHLISKQLAEADTRRAVAVSGDETLSIMVNEEDHLRMQLLAPGMQLDSVHKRLDHVDDIIESRLDYAFSPRWGYMTACPTNVGTGIRFSCMMHLPALKMANELERVQNAARDLHLAVRGYYGEGSDSAGDFYQVSNQVTLGKTEKELLEEFTQVIVPRLVEYERQSRRILAEKSPAVLDDRANRALGILQGARLIGVEEAMKLLSRLRLGIYLNRLPGLSLQSVNAMFLQIQPGHLKLHAKADLSPEQLREARATLIRQTLN